MRWQRYVFRGITGAAVVGSLWVGPAGCGKSGDRGPGADLAPGTMKVIAVEPVDRAEASDSPAQPGKGGNLLLCGDFANWWTGAPAPNGLFPPDGSRSLISRTPEGGIRQEWTRPEDTGVLKQRMRSQPVTLQPGSYRLSITVSGVDQGAVMVSLWRDDGEAFVNLPVEPILLLPGPAATRTYVRSFTLDAPAKVSVASEAVAGTPPQTAAQWLHWTLQRVG